MPVKDQKCGTCFYARRAGEDIVSCQRFPPLVTKVENNTITSHWPLLRIEAWCGEWRQAPVTNIARLKVKPTISSGDAA